MYMKVDKEFLKKMAARIKWLRKDAGYDTQDQIADEIGAEREAYAHYETGRSPIPAHLVEKFCNATKCSIDYLYTGEENEILSAYRKLEDDDKKVVDKFLGLKSFSKKNNGDSQRRA